MITRRTHATLDETELVPQQAHSPVWIIVMRFLLIMIAASSIPQVQADWPQFRGPGGHGIAHESNIPLQWSGADHVRWVADVPGTGWSSPVVQGDRVWLTTAIATQPTPEQIEAQFKQSQLDREKFTRRQVAGSVSLRLMSFNRNSGEVLLDTELAFVENPEAIHVGNSHASPTPFIEGDRLFVHFGIYGTFCLDRDTHRVIWRRSIPVFYSVGVGSSPVLCNGLLVLVCDGIDEQFVIALDKHTGETTWKTSRPPFRVEDGQYRKAYSTPLFVSYGGRDQLVIPGAQWVVSYDPATGDEIWRVDHGAGFSNVPRPVYHNGVVFVCTGYGAPQLWAIRVNGSGDVSNSHVKWKEKSQIPKNPSPLLVNGLLFVINDNGVMTCLDSDTGKTQWRKRIPGNYSASPVFANGHVFLFSHEGTVTAIEASAEPSGLVESNMDDQLMASPAILSQSVLLRTRHKLYCIQ